MIDANRFRYVDGDDVLDAARAMLERPDSFARFDSEESLFVTSGFCGLAVHRDSDALGRSNWRVISSDILAVDPDAYVYPTGHWAVGWLDHLVIPVLIDADRGVVLENLTDTFWRVFLRNLALEDYPVASDEDFSEEEYGELLETLEQCYGFGADDSARVASELAERGDAYRAEDLRADDVRDVATALGIELEESYF